MMGVTQRPGTVAGTGMVAATTHHTTTPTHGQADQGWPWFKEGMHTTHMAATHLTLVRLAHAQALI